MVDDAIVGGPQWRTIFGQAKPLDPFPVPDPDNMAGLLWHRALHADMCLARRRLWQAGHGITAMRDLVIAVACARLGLPAANSKGGPDKWQSARSGLQGVPIRADYQLQGR